MKKCVQEILLRKTLLYMKYTSLILIVICSTVISVMASGVKAQDILEKKVSVSFNDVSLVTALNQISRQSGVDFTYNNSVLNTDLKFSASVKNVALKKLLDQLFTNRPFGYTAIDNEIAIKYQPEKQTKQAPKKKFVDMPQPIQRDMNGTVTDTTGRPLSGATIKVQNTSIGTTTDIDGRFTLKNVPDKGYISVSYIGYITRVIILTQNTPNPLNIVLRPESSQLDQVTVVSNGYQNIPQERATGSFVKIDSALLNRRVSTNFIDRLQGITSGLIFNSNQSSLDPNASPVSIRGRSTIFANTSPLIIVDNFPYDGDLDNINPNDIQNITILKDAAAASIWGARAANGVIVVTTKNGKLNQALQVDINSNVTVGKKPNLFYNPNFLDANDFINLEQYLYQQGYYDANLNSNSTRMVVTPVVDILAAQSAGTISAAQAQAQINALRNNDVRNDFNKYFYRNSFNEQSSVSLSGGGQKATYAFSAGYDDDLSNLKRNDYDRITLNENSTYHPVKNLELSIGLHYTQNKQDNNNPGMGGITSNGTALYPYAQLADANGNPLPVAKDYPTSFKLAQTGLLDWQYSPLEELYLANNQTHVYDFRINPSLKYRLTGWLNAEVLYQYEKQISESDNIQSQDSYYVRNLVNLYSQVNNGAATSPVPNGDIYDKGLSDYSSSIIRGQLDFNKSFNSKNIVSAIAGVEYQEEITNNSANRLYGYNPETATSVPVDYTTLFPQYQNLYANATIPYLDKFDVLTNEFRSYYANASYTYDDRYVVSGSARYDQSNLFGVNTNQKGVPLWSAGLSWNISKESFYNIDWLPYLKLRATYGVNGNIDKSLTAYTTGYYSISSVTNAQDVYITNPPNPDLQWEQDKMLNIGLDFGGKDKWISGSIEYYHRTGTNLVGYTNVDPTTGFYSYKGNVADMKGSGIDLQVNTRNLTGAFKWNTTFLFSKATNEVTKYNVVVPNDTHVQLGDGTAVGTNSDIFTPVVGRPVFSVFSYKWAGLDPKTGDPQGYLNGAVSKDYGSIENSTNINDLVYNGSATPTIFGSLRNDFSYRAFSLSVDITYKLGYYFRRPSVNYQYLFGLYEGNSDYTKRWQKPGDEKTTNVPSMVYPDDASRDNFYTYSSVLVEKGDNIRLQDLKLSYNLKNVRLGKMSFQRVQLFAYANNLGIIWKATKSGLDPDYINGYPDPATLSLGLNVHF